MDGRNRFQLAVIGQFPITTNRELGRTIGVIRLNSEQPCLSGHCTLMMLGGHKGKAASKRQPRAHYRDQVIDEARDLRS